VKRGALLIACVLIAYLCFVVAKLPASVLLAQLEPYGIAAVSTSGTVWDGQARGVRADKTSLGDLDWQLAPGRLLAGKVAGRFALERPGAHARGEAELGLGGRLELQRVNFLLPIAALHDLGAPQGWRGDVSGSFDSLTIENRWLADATGTLEVSRLFGPLRDPVAMGSYRVVLPAPAATDSPDALVGALEDLDDGPLAVSGTITLQPDRTYLIEGLVAARAGAPQNIVDSLRFLGAPDAQGRRPFSIAGSL
jgi:general secretion pathway protein N